MIRSLITGAPLMAIAIRDAAEAALVVQLGPEAGMILLPREQYDALEQALDRATGCYRRDLYLNANDND